jgi:two-component sensor histidine kinase
MPPDIEPSDVREAPWSPRFWPVNLAVWTLVGAFFTSRVFTLAFVNRPKRMPDYRAVIGNMADAYVWALLTPVIFAVARRWPLGRSTWRRSLPVHVVTAVACACFSILINALLGSYNYPEEPFAYWSYFAWTFHYDLQWYTVIVGAFHGVEYYRKYHDRELRASQLATRLATSRLEALKTQIQPHFLFNTLHAISELVHEDPDAADLMIARLGDLLRLTMDDAAAQQVPLAREIELLNAYLEIQRTRFQDRLQVEMRITPEARRALVPNFVLQPLVENAIRHGTAPMAGAGRIVVSGARRGGTLELEVRDNGQGLSAERREGVGLRNTRERLAEMYGGAQRFEVRAGEDGGTVATVVIPFQPAGEVETSILSAGTGTPPVAEAV